MAYFEEFFSQIRNGAKIRKASWSKDCYVWLDEKGQFKCKVDTSTDFFFLLESVFKDDDWELFKEPEFDWDCLIKNNCLCWFWNDNECYKVMGQIGDFNEECSYPYEMQLGERGYSVYKHCVPVRKKEVTFYEEIKNVGN